MSTIFRTESRNFPTPVDEVGYVIEGVSAEFLNGEIGDKSTYNCLFTFYTKDAYGQFVAQESITKEVSKEILVPGMGLISIVSSLFSGKRQDIYNGASLLAKLYGYTLLPIEQQTELIADNIY